jgi:16S rRNA (cytidine1402-2'-O)-methyltransferase
MCVARELTKAHQEFLRGSSREVLTRLSEPRGEFTVVLGPAATGLQHKDLAFSDEAVADEFGELTKYQGFARRDAIAAVARKFGRTTREVYAAVERTKLAAD